MSTRCQIAFYESNNQSLDEPEALIYRHHDGYPEGVIPDIKPILEDFNNNRGLYDVEYASAWLVTQLKDDYLDIGISRFFHGDIEYLYAIYPAHETRGHPHARIDVYKVDGVDDSRPTIETAVFVKTEAIE